MDNWDEERGDVWERRKGRQEKRCMGGSKGGRKVI